MVKEVSSPSLSSEPRSSAQLPLAHDLANRTKGRFIASILASDQLPDMTAEQVRILPQLLMVYLQSQTSRVFTAEREPPLSCLVSPGSVSLGPDGTPQSISVGFTYLFFLGDKLRACTISSKSVMPWSPDTIRGICELDRAGASGFLNDGQTIRIYGQEVQIKPVAPEDVIESMMSQEGLSARWVADRIGLNSADAERLASIINKTISDAPRLDVGEEFVKTLDGEVASTIRSDSKEGEENSADIYRRVITDYNKALLDLERKEGALKTPLDVEDAIRQLTPFVATEDGAASLSCSALLLLLREREILEDKVFQISNETADPRLVELLESIDPEIAALKAEINRRKEQGDIWAPDDNVNFVPHPVDIPLTYAEGSQTFDILTTLSTWRVKNLAEEEYEALQKLPSEALLRIREVLKFFQQQFSSEAELLKALSDNLRSGLSEDKKVRFGGTREEHRFAFLIQGEPTVKLEFEIDEDLDLHGSPRAHVFNVRIEPFNPEQSSSSRGES